MRSRGPPRVEDAGLRVQHQLNDVDESGRVERGRIVAEDAGAEGRKDEDEACVRAAHREEEACSAGERPGVGHSRRRGQPAARLGAAWDGRVQTSGRAQ